MNTGHDHDDEARDRDFDTRLRGLHARALGNVSPRTSVQLRPRHATPARAARPRLHAWPLAATCAIALAAVGLFLRHPAQQAAPDTAVVAPATDNEPGDVYVALDESPELYEWLASNDADIPATE